MNFCIVTVNYKNTTHTEKLIKSIDKFSDKIDLKIIIVDNSSTLKSKKMLERAIKNSKHNFKIIPYKKNLYYWPAIKKTILKEFKSIKDYPDWMIFCNNDIEFSDINFFKKLAKYDRSKFSIIGPSIFSKSKNLNPFMLSALSRQQKFFWKIYFKSFYFSLILNTISFCKNFFKKNNYSQNENLEVYAVHGSAIIFSKFFFEMGGQIDSNFKLYAEEITTAEIAKRINCKIFFIPKLKLTHNQHSSIKHLNRKKRFLLAKESHFYFISNYLDK